MRVPHNIYDVGGTAEKSRFVSDNKSHLLDLRVAFRSHMYITSNVRI